MRSTWIRIAPSARSTGSALGPSTTLQSPSFDLLTMKRQDCAGTFDFISIALLHLTDAAAPTRPRDRGRSAPLRDSDHAIDARLRMRNRGSSGRPEEENRVQSSAPHELRVQRSDP